MVHKKGKSRLERQLFVKQVFIRYPPRKIKEIIFSSGGSAIRCPGRGADRAARQGV